MADKTSVSAHNLNDDLAFVLRNSQSRRFLWWIIGQCGIYDATVGNEVRNLGIKIVSHVEKTNPMAYAAFFYEMTKEEIDHRMLMEAQVKAPNAVDSE